MKIAFLEDDPAFAENITTTLATAGHEVVHFASGRECLKAVSSDHFDICVFDRFNAQIEQVRNASQQLSFLQNDRKELLAFISHDLRAPIANAMLILNENNPQASAICLFSAGARFGRGLFASLTRRDD